MASYERWRWRGDVCDRLSEQEPLWAEPVGLAPDQPPLPGWVEALALITLPLTGWYPRQPAVWVVVYAGWMACARRGDPLKVLWHAPLEGEPDVATRPLESPVSGMPAGHVEVTVGGRRPFAFIVDAGQVDGLLAAIAAGAGR